MTGCRCCVFLTIFTLSVVFGKSFPKHVSLVAAGNRSRVQRLRRADLLAVDPIRATGDSLAGLCFDIEAYCPLIFGLARPVYLWKS
ncbi:unnamed protein product [Effrenium voratum]|uniref:Secreted protein n=1 Tax=Effrenium voratum TaxID=2562239 RepID=A0AA36N6K0_9DINO|nr:unnamed protein product [Effrenium voratum]CAJ1448929.1 unnamed protein product [Effrenium voratum]